MKTMILTACKTLYRNGYLNRKTWEKASVSVLSNGSAILRVYEPINGKMTIERLYKTEKNAEKGLARIWSCAF